MVLFNYSTKELTAKVVYYGPGLCGKTTNLQWIHEKLPIRNKGKMLSLATEADRTLFFDFLPIELGSIRGMKTRIQLYTVPGQVFYNATRRMVLKGADCVVFVADSQEAMLDADLDSMANLKENLEVNEINPDEIPMVLQYNKRDLPNALPLEVMNQRLNPRGLPFFEAVAMKGQGVEETLKGATTLVFKSLAGKYGGGEPGRGPSTLSPTPAPVIPAAPPAPAPPPVAAAPAAIRPAVPAPRPPAPAPPPPALSFEAEEEPPSIDAILDDAPAPASASAAASTDDLLDSIDLDAPAAAPEFSLDAELGGTVAEEEEEPVEELEVLTEDEPEPEPVAAPAGRPARGPFAVEDAPRRGPRLPDLSLDEEEQVLVGGHGTNPALRQSAAPSPAAGPAPVHIPVEIAVPRGQREITVPIEITIGRPGAEVHLRLDIALKVKLG